MGRKSEVSPAERREIVLKVLRKEESTAALARKHGVAEASIYRWYEQFLAAGLDGLKPRAAGSGASAEVDRLQAEVGDLKISLAEYSIANRILKKRAEILR